MNEETTKPGECPECHHVRYRNEAEFHTLDCSRREKTRYESHVGHDDGEPCTAECKSWDGPRLSFEVISPAEAEARLEKVALTGLQNIYHAITGKDCPRYLALGMATSAVSSLKSENAALTKALIDIVGGRGNPAKIARVALSAQVKK